jgi:hypothetical protein
MKNYPTGSPIMAYMGNHTENVTTTYSQSLGSYPEYGDASRAYNAMAFARGWNGTIIPPKTGSTGKRILVLIHALILMLLVDMQPTVFVLLPGHFEEQLQVLAYHCPMEFYGAN